MCSARASPTPRRLPAAAPTPRSTGCHLSLHGALGLPPSELLSLDRKSVATSRGAGDFQMGWLRLPLRLLAVAWNHSLAPSWASVFSPRERPGMRAARAAFSRFKKLIV